MLENAQEKHLKHNKHAKLQNILRYLQNSKFSDQGNDIQYVIPTIRSIQDWKTKQNKT